MRKQGWLKATRLVTVRLYPLKGELLGFVYLFVIHPLFEDVFDALCNVSSLGHREIVPHVGEHNILRYTLASGVHNPEVGLGNRISLLSG